MNRSFTDRIFYNTLQLTAYYNKSTWLVQKKTFMIVNKLWFK